MSEEKKSENNSLMVPMMIVVAIAAAVGTWYFLRINTPAQPVVIDPVYYKMEPVVVNLEGKNPKHFFKVEPVLVSRNPALADKFEGYRPVIRNYLIDKLRKETVLSLSEPQSFERVRSDVTEGVKALVIESGGVDYIDDVVFNEFVIQ